MKANVERNRLKDLLTDTITLLCKNGLQYKQEFSVDALIGITLDKEDVFLVNIKEIVKSALANKDDDEEDVSQSDSDIDAKSSSSRKRRRKRKSNQTTTDGNSSAKQRRGSDSDNDDYDNNDNEYDESENDMASGMKLEKQRRDSDLVYVKHEPGTDGDSSYIGAGDVYPNVSSMNPADPMNLHPSQHAGGDSQVWSDTSMNTSQLGIPADPSQQGDYDPESLWIDGKIIYICRFCSKPTTSRSNLKQHIQNLHSGEKQLFVCSCGKTYKWKSTLTKHLKDTGHTATTVA